MRSMGRLTTGLALLALLPATAAAQEARPFTDSWFWGVKGGAVTVETPFDSRLAPTAGIEWLITRSRTGLYLSVEQGFFSDEFGLVGDEASDDFLRTVELTDLRRASFALMAFPGRWGATQPYAGAGVALQMVREARPLGDYDDMEHMALIDSRVEDRRSRTSLLLMGGVQGQAGPANLFGQVSIMPTGSRFLLDGGETMYLLEVGVRWNVGSAIERLDR